MMKLAFAFLLISAMAFADQFTFQGQGATSNLSSTTETWQIGYGAQYIAGGENMIGELLILAGVALIYIALVTKQKEGENHGTG